MVGIYQSRSVNLSRVAGKIPGQAKLVSVTRRLSRLLANPAIVARDWYEPIAREWLESQARNGQQIRLIVDGSKVGFAHQLLIISLAYRRRAIPIAWTWVGYVRGHSNATTQLDLLTYVRSLLPQGFAVLLVGDSEFGPVEVLKQLDQWGWDYVLRQKTSVHVCLARETEWHDLGSWAKKAGQSRWLGKGWLTESEIYPVNLLVHSAVGEEQPWCLVTNLPDRALTLKAYGRRTWIEFNFRDAKQFWGLENFMNVEKTAVTNAANLSLFMVNVAQLLMSEFRQTDPDFSVLDLKAHYRGCKYAAELIKMLPQKPDPIFIAQLFLKISAMGSIHRPKSTVSSS